MTKKELWKKQIDNYTELIIKYKWKQEPMLALVNEFVNNKIGEQFFPSNSHAAIGLSRFKNYPINRDFNMVFIAFNEDNQKFGITFLQGKKIKPFLQKEVTKIQQKDLNRIENWLNLI